jgi:hypothetical protein
MLGQKIAEPAGPPAGRIETTRPIKVFHGDGRALELWGFAERNGATAECIVVVDGTPYRRPRTNGRAYGWKGVAPVPKVSPLCAVALFPGEDQFAPLDGCQTIGEKPCDALTRRFLTLAAANTGPNI